MKNKWKPKKFEKCWRIYLGKTGRIFVDFEHKNGWRVYYDCMPIGGYFRTKAEAQKKLKQILKILKS